MRSRPDTAIRPATCHRYTLSGFGLSVLDSNKNNMLNRLSPTMRKRMAWLLWPDGHGVVRRDGALFLLDLNNWYDKVILKWGPGEPERRIHLLDNIRRRECDTFLDVGANFGTYAAFVALCTKATTIIAYEPDRRSYDRLRTHLLLNRVHKSRDPNGCRQQSQRNGAIYTSARRQRFSVKSWRRWDRQLFRPCGAPRRRIAAHRASDRAEG
jgi:hypothetical protein